MLQWFILGILACVLALLLGQTAIVQVVGAITTWFLTLILVAIPFGLIAVLCTMEGR